MTTAPDADELAVKARLQELIDGPAPDAQPDAVDAAAAAAAAVAQPAPGSAAEPVSDAQPDAPRRSRNRIPDWWTGKPVDLTPEPDADAQPEPDAGAQPDPEPDAQPQAETDHADDTDEDAADDGGEEDPHSPGKPDAQPLRTRLRIPRRSSAPAAGPGAVLAAPAPRMSLLDAVNNVTPRIRWLVLHASAAAAGYHLGLVQWATRTNAWITEHGWHNATAGFWIAVGVGCELLRRRARDTWLPIRWLAAIPIASLVTGSLLYGTGWQNLELPL